MELKFTLESIIELHERMRNSFNWTSPSTAWSRRNYEQKHSMTNEFTVNELNYQVVQTTTCSCKNIYYKMKIYINGEESNKDIRLIKNLLKQEENNVLEQRK